MKMKTEEQSKQENGIVWIGINRLHPHKDNPRKDLGDLRELADSIRAKGVLQNLTVVRDGDDYTIIIGHRRTAAAKMAGLTKLPCIIAEMTPAEQVQTMLLENMQRSDLTVYEQAKGFQMMLDFGDSVDYIAEKTGFSKTTIRRRLKMAELDGEVLRRAALRKVDLMDYDKLTGIEDINTRNAVLAEIGTNNFNNALKKALDAQTAKRKKEKWEKIFSERGMTEIPIADSWNAKYRRLVTLDGEPGDEKIGDYLKKYSSLYFSFGYGGSVTLLADELPTEEKSEAEAEEKRKRDAEQLRIRQLSDLAKRTFALRFEFVKNYSYRDSKKYLKKISDWMCLREIISMLSVAMFTGYATVTASKKRFAELFDVKGGDDYGKVAELVEKHPEKTLLMNVYAQWCDSENENCTDWSGNYRENPKLVNLYKGLCSLGYVMSDEEKEMLNGKHILYRKNGEEEPIDTENDEVASTKEESEDDFDIDLKKKLGELLGELKEK